LVTMMQMMSNQPFVVEEEFTTSTIFGLEQQVSVGVVSRATTPAAQTLAFLTWTKRRGPTPVEDSGTQDDAEHKEEEDQRQQSREDDEGPHQRHIESSVEGEV
ncbi:unnamed protein product, partial [Meganyctiphanes norvegica]